MATSECPHPVGPLEADGDRVTWTYDNTYQLRNENRSGTNAYNVTHTYDPVGNRLVKLDSVAATTYSYDAANQLTTSLATAGTTTYTYDAAGNLAVMVEPSGVRTTNTWDDENRLTTRKRTGFADLTNLYNADGLRVQKSQSGTKRFAIDIEPHGCSS